MVRSIDKTKKTMPLICPGTLNNTLYEALVWGGFEKGKKFSYVSTKCRFHEGTPALHGVGSAPNTGVQEVAIAAGRCD